METTDGSLAGTGGVEIAWRGWPAPPRARGTIVLVHGLCEHGGRHGDVAAWLAGRGFAVVAPDLRGHGRSGGPRAVIEDAAAAVADLAAVTDLAPLGRDGPTLVLGHGLGGALALLLALERPLDGLVLTAPMLRAPRSTPIDATALSRDPQVVAAFDADPLVHHGAIPAQTVAALTAALPALTARAGELTAPFLLMHGDADRLADPEDSRALHTAAGADDKVLVLWHGLFHEIFHEPPEDRELPFERLGDWLDEHAP